jgi:hypothetical protein
MKAKLVAACSTLGLLIGLSIYSLGKPPQNREMAHQEPHMSAALGHLQEAKTELERATPNKGGHREKAMQLVDQAIEQVKAGEAYYEQHPGR